MVDQEPIELISVDRLHSLYDVYCWPSILHPRMTAVHRGCVELGYLASYGGGRI